MKKVVFALSLAGLTVLYSCQKNTPKNNLKNYTTLNQTNSNNLNYIGDIHNECLDNINNLSNFTNITQIEKYDFIKQFTENKLNNQVTLTYNTFEENSRLFHISFLNAKNIGNLLLQELLITQDVNLFIDKIFMSIVTNNQDNKMNPIEFNERIKNIELDIISMYGNTNINNIQNIDLRSNLGKSTYLLGACAIAKSSYLFWFNERNKQTSNWKDVLYNMNNNYEGGISLLAGLGWTKLWKALKKAGADVAGFLANAPCLIAGPDNNLDGNPDFYYPDINITNGVAGAQEASSHY